jgi:hypothetical protein
VTSNGLPSFINVSGRMCRMTCVPSGTPTARLGRICGMSAMLVRE